MNPKSEITTETITPIIENVLIQQNLTQKLTIFENKHNDTHSTLVTMERNLRELQQKSQRAPNISHNDLENLKIEIQSVQDFSASDTLRDSERY